MICRQLGLLCWLAWICIDALYFARRVGLEPNENAWRVQQALMEFLETDWEKPDEGLWEIRGPRRHFTHSKVMAWVAVDRAVKSVEKFGLSGPIDKWRRLRKEIHDQVCREGFDPELNSFVQYYGSKRLDASLLMLPLVGFLPPKDLRIQGTVKAIQKRLMQDGFVRRYSSDPEIDGLPSGEGVFLICTFWLADNLALQGRYKEAAPEDPGREPGRGGQDDDEGRLGDPRGLEGGFERLMDLRNDVGLLSEEYDTKGRRLIGNFPQAFSHVGLINTVLNLTKAAGPVKHRQSR
ncbi:MAG: hypothetical protein C4291_02650 [Candidatus Dadabacteria bacterium]